MRTTAKKAKKNKKKPVCIKGLAFSFIYFQDDMDRAPEHDSIPGAMYEQNKGLRCERV